SEGTARLNLGYTRVVAPVAGRVGLRAVDVGNVVSNSDANGVVLITQVSPIDVVFAVPQDRVGDLQQGGATPAPIKATAFDRTRSTVLDTGVFASLDNQVDTTTGTVKAKARFNNAQLALFPSQFVNVQLQVRVLENAVVVPVTAVRQGGNGDYVYVLNADRTVSLRTVTRGLATVDKIVISKGLQAGERVITEGADRLKDGARVTLSGDAPRTAASGAGGSGQRRRRTDGAAGAPGAEAPASAVSGSAPSGAAPLNRAPASGSAPGNGSNGGSGDGPATAATTASNSNGPTPEQRQRMLDRLKDDPVALAQRKELLAQLDKGDPAAIARWRTMMENRRQGDRPAQ
ncbi:MAG: efflux RND transporter periplasmic adaptor subunit, partial [Polaromonas sp.]